MDLTIVWLPQQMEPQQDAQVIATTFARFPELPAKLRLRIWGFAFPGPRTVSIRAVGRRAKHQTKDDKLLKLVRYHS